jgi:prepilin-type N-terminal cleavage/methylation domain-containing protein
MRSHRRGFTLIEMMLTVAIIGILAALAYPVLIRQRPRAQLLGTTTELFSLLRNARQNALATGRNTVVMLFPQAPSSERGTGRVVVVEDPANTWFGGTAPNFQTFSATASPRADSLIGVLEFPNGITVGFGGSAAPTLRAPYANIPSGSACTFCSGTDGRGAIMFDYRGRAWFYDASGTRLGVTGGTIALQGPDEMQGFRALVISAATGSVVAVNAG